MTGRPGPDASRRSKVDLENLMAAIQQTENRTLNTQDFKVQCFRPGPKP